MLQWWKPNCAKVVCWHATQPAHVLEMHLSHGIVKRTGNKRQASSLCGMLHPVSTFWCDASYVRASSSDKKYKCKMPLISLSSAFLLEKQGRWGKLFKMYRMGRLYHIKKITNGCYSVQYFNATIYFAMSFFLWFSSLQVRLDTVPQGRVQVTTHVTDPHVTMVNGDNICMHRHVWFQDKTSLYIS